MKSLNRNNGKRTDGLADPATQSVPEPGDYPLGSLESRAAARAVIEERKIRAVHDGLLTEIRVVECSAEGQRLAEVIRIPPMRKGQTS